MKCPNDGATLLMAERHGVPIDYCPDCRGVWLERGRLDQMLESMPDRAVPDDTNGDDHRHRDEHRDSEHHDGARQKDGRRRKGGVGGLLGDLLGGGD